MGRPRSLRARVSALRSWWIVPRCILAYVSGRHLASVQEAIEQYVIPRPDLRDL